MIVILSFPRFRIIGVMTEECYCSVGMGAVEHTDCISAGGVRPNECPGYDTKQSDGEVPVMLELWGMRSTPSLPPLSGPHWPGVVAPDMGQIELNCVLMLNWIAWNRAILTFNCVFTLKGIVWIRTVWLNWIAWNRNVFDNWTVYSC